VNESKQLKGKNRALLFKVHDVDGDY